MVPSCLACGLVWKAALALIPVGEGLDRVRRRDGVILAPTGVRGGYATYFLRAYAGAPVAQTLRPFSLRCGERLCDTMRALPENVAAPYAYRVQQRDGVIHPPLER